MRDTIVTKNDKFPRCGDLGEGGGVRSGVPIRDDYFIFIISLSF